LGLWRAQEAADLVGAEGGLGSLHGLNSENSSVGAAGDAEIALQRRGIGLERAARRIVNDGAALQYHNTVGQPQNLLRILLDNDRADATRAGNAAQRPQQFFDDDRRQPLGRLVQKQDIGIEGQRPAA